MEASTASQCCRKTVEKNLLMYTREDAQFMLKPNTLFIQ